VAAVSSYASHVLALSRDGNVYAWGKSDKGRLGIGPLPVIQFKTRTPATMPFVPFPTRIPDLAGVTAVSAGSTHSLARLEDGTVRAWGENRWGQLGDGTVVTRDRPVVVPGVRDAVAVAAGGAGFSAALLADGSVMTWGNNTLASMGRSVSGNALVVPVPAVVPGVRDVRTIAVGEGHVLALHRNGTVSSWGDDTLGTLGRGRDKTLTPGLVPRLTDVHDIVAFESSSLAILANGRIMNWGVVRPWTRPPDEGGRPDISRSPILFWRDGFEQP
jgi:alpha-tubulin suppressor-like RCC1 family protein